LVVVPRGQLDVRRKAHFAGVNAFGQVGGFHALNERPAFDRELVHGLLDQRVRFDQACLPGQCEFEHVAGLPVSRDGGATSQPPIPTR